MALFDPYFALIRDYEDDLRVKGRNVRVWSAGQWRVVPRPVADHFP
jgi:hypothetical protein